MSTGKKIDVIGKMCSNMLVLHNVWSWDWKYKEALNSTFFWKRGVLTTNSSIWMIIAPFQGCCKLQISAKLIRFSYRPSVKPNLIGQNENVLRLVSSIWLLSDWLEETVGRVHSFSSVSKSTNAWGDLQMHKNQATNSCNNLQMHIKWFKCQPDLCLWHLYFFFFVQIWFYLLVHIHFCVCVWL